MSRRSVKANVAALALIVFAAVPLVAAAERRDVVPGKAREVPKVHIENFGRVDANYFRGAEPDDGEYANLAALGIRTVIDLRSNDVDKEDRLLVEHAGMHYVQIPMTTHEPPTRMVIEQFLRIVDDPDARPVYVHCVGGRHRTGVMTAVYRMAREGWPADRAFKEMKAYNFGADFLHPEFKKFVYAYRPNPSAVAVVE
jgi:protein tyrosine/serine phosphatase